MNDLRSIQPSRFLAVTIVLCVICHTIFSEKADGATCVPPPSGILSWWEGEGDATDVMMANDGTVAGSAMFGPGEIGQGFVLDGNGAAVQIGDAPALQLQDLTVEAWVRRSDPSRVTAYWTGIGFIFAYGVGGYGFAANNSGQLVLSAVGVSSVSSPVILTDTNFHHVAVTKSGSSVIFYEDGVAYPAASYNPGFTFTSPAAIGAQGNDLSSSFWGTIDEPAVYNRALTADEIQNIFAAGSAGKCSPNNPPSITSQPADLGTIQGRPASFNVSARGSLPLAYQWMHYGTNLPGATNPSLSVDNVQPSDGGPYSVEITNDFGSAQSSDANLTLLPYACISAPPGLVGWWAGENDGTDWAYDRNNGTVSSGTSYTQGEVGQAFSFDGVNSAVVVPASQDLAFQSLTIEAWIVIEDTVLARPIVEYANPTGLCAMNFWYNIGPGVQGVSGGLYGFFRGAGNTSVDLGTAPGVLASNQWNHVALTWDAHSRVLALYANGVSVGVKTSTVPVVPQSFMNVNLGYRPAGSSELWGGRRHLGLLDEVSIYNRALSSNEIMAIYAVGQGGKCALPPTAPIIDSQPVGTTVAVGVTTTLSVGVTGSHPLSYQWHFRNAGLVGATNSTLTITNVQASNAGPYSVTITNPLGSATSSNAQLKVTVVSVYANNALLTNSQYSFGSPFTIRMTNAYSSGSIFYTLDGSEPSFLSTQYSAPFTVSNDVVLRAVGYSSDFSQDGETDPFTLLIVPSFTLLVTNNGGGGSLSVSPPGSTYLSNTVVTLTATPSSGWTFLQWLGDVNGTNPVSTVTMTRNKTVQAVFGTTLSTTTAGAGSVNMNPAGGLYPYGTAVWLSGIPQPGNYFGVWGNAGSGNVNPLAFTVTNANPTVSSLFAAVGAGQAALTVVPLGKGQITVTPRANVYSTGTPVSISAVPGTGQRFLGWSGDATGTSNPLSLAMNANKTIYANFSHNPVLSVQASYEGMKPEGFILTLTGDFTARYEIDTSSNLVNWAPLTTVTNSFGSVPFTDPAAPSLMRRFYRALWLP